MDSFVKSIFENAVLREEAANLFYKNLALRAISSEVRDLFLKLADEELVHASLLSKMDPSLFKNLPFNELHLVKEKNFASDEIKEINEALDKAIVKEQKAYEDYKMLASHMLDSAKEAFTNLAIQELRHKTLLQKEKLNFNSNDWKAL